MPMPEMTKEKRYLFTAAAVADLKIKLAAQKFAAAKGAETPAEEAAEGEWASTIAGYVIKWGDVSTDRGGYTVKIAPNSVKFDPTTFALFHHNYEKVLGNTENKTLRLIPDNVGVRVEIDLPDTTAGRDTSELVEDQYIRGMSFSCYPETWETSEVGDKTEITLTSFRCDEVTVTAIPAFGDTSIEVVSESEPAASGAGDYSKTTLAADAAKLQSFKLALLRA